jgi:PAS domain S-box-containing protein
MTEPAAPGPARGQAAADDAWPDWYPPLVGTGLVLTLVVSFLAFIPTIADGIRLDTVLMYLVIPIAVVGSIFAARRFDAAWAYVAAALLDIEALLAAARLTIGLAFAVILPFAGLVLIVSFRRARAQRFAFIVAWAATVAAVAVAVTVGPAALPAGIGNADIAILGSAVFAGFVLLHLAVLTELRVQASEAAEAELASRHLAEAELDRTSRLLTAIVDASPVPTQAFDTQGRVVLWNPASERVFGWSSGEVVGSRLPVAMTPVDARAEGADRIRRTLAGSVANGERVRRLARDGHEVWVDIYAGPMLDAEGRTMGVAGQLVDVTERITLEAQLRQSARMEAIGQLSGGIAHDFNNLLTVIRGNAELLQSSLGPGQEGLRTDVDEILQAADRAGNLTRQLLAFARRAVLEPRVLDPAGVIREFAPMLGRLIGAHVNLVLDLAPDTGSVRVDRGQLEQIVLNLALNARDAMPDGGTLRIATRNRGDGESAQVLLTVTDTGFGMDDATRARIFEPFFTTKEQGKGTGMGLATVFGIVSMFEGEIEVESEPDQGTTFTIRLPRANGVAPASPEPGAANGAPHGTETILLIEDEPAVRAFARTTLAGLGYTVLEASGETEAFGHARGHEGGIDLIVSDVVLPGTPGPALVRQLVGLRPGTRTLLCSGFPAEASVGSETIDPDRFLAKPYTREGLARAVRDALDA